MVLAACAELMASHAHAAAMPAQRMAGLLLMHAVDGLPSSTAGTDSRSSSGSGLTAMLWQQIEQSGLLQQLPGQLSVETAQHIRTPYRHSALGMYAAERMSRTTSNLLHTVGALQRVYPMLFSAYPAGRQCLVLAMQLALSSLQYISTAMTKSGRQEWMENWLDSSWTVGTTAASTLFLLNQEASGTGVSSSTQHQHASPGAACSSSSASGDALPLLQAKQTLKWCCLDAVVPMLAQDIQQAGNSDTASGSRSTATGSSSSTGTATSSRQHRQQAPARSVLKNQWLPAALAPSMPTAYSSMLKQLGCSREVGLWVALRNILGDDHGEGSPSTLPCIDGTVLIISRSVQVALRGYETLLRNSFMQAMGGNLDLHKGSAQTAALHLSMSAISLQWLSSMPTGSLAALKECETVCEVAALACTHGQMMMQQQEPLRPEQRGAASAGDRELFVVTNNAVAQLSAAVLQQLLTECRGGESSTGGTTTSNRNSMLFQSCQHVTFMLATAFATAAELQRPVAATTGQQNALGGVLQAPVSLAECCKLLQDCVRLVATARAAVAGTAAAAAAAAAAAPSNSSGDVTSRMLLAVTNLFGGVARQPNTSVLVVSGPLVAAAGNVSSPEALQLFGLLCSMLKLYSSSSSNIDDKMAGNTSVEQQNISTAVSSMVRIALTQGSAAHGAHTSSSSTADAGSCTAVLPWLVLLGRCCWGAATLLQDWQVNLDSDGLPDSLQGIQWIMDRCVLVHNLQLLQSSLAGVVKWLAAAGTVQQLTALGYQPQDVQQQLVGAADALLPLCTDLMTTDPFGGTMGEILKAGQQQLQAAGKVLACFAMPHACNNLACSNVWGPSEALLVGGRSCICAGCLTARYCGRACQRATWRQHKPVCKALAAAAAAGGLGAEAAAVSAPGAVTGSQGESGRQ